MRASNSADLETAQTGFADGSSVLDGLSTEQGERLARVLDDYLSRLDEGLPPSAQKLINENPDLAEPLASYLDQLEALHDVAVGFSPGTDSRHDAAWNPTVQHNLNVLISNVRGMTNVASVILCLARKLGGVAWASFTKPDRFRSIDESP